jgi:murein DD-endopeptidase
MTRRDLVALLYASSIVVAQDLDIVEVEVTVPTPPTAIPAGGEYVLVYELHITNMQNKGDLSIAKVEAVIEGKSASLQGGLLEAMTRRPGAQEGVPTLLRPGMRGIVYMFLRSTAPPHTITHRLTLDPGGVVECRAAPVKRNVLKLAPPVAGDQWMAANGPGAKTHHRWSMLSSEGRSVIPQRYAIDWNRRYPDGSMHQGDGRTNDQHRCYGAEALAAANGRVEAVLDGLPDTDPGQKPPAPLALKTMGGNQIVIELGRGAYAMYAHLKPGSIRVKRGDQVKKGQVLALIGNSGNSTAPHLHFHVGDAPALLGSEGLPYVIDEFRRDGKTHRGELPLQDWVVEF